MLLSGNGFEVLKRGPSWHRGHFIFSMLYSLVPFFILPPKVQSPDVHSVTFVTWYH